MTREDQVQDWAKRTLATHGAPDLLVNNAAAINANAPLWEVPADEFDRVVDVNLKGVAHVLRHFVPAMIARGHGQIGIMSSLAGFIPLADAPSYCASKAAVLSYGLGLRGAVEDKGIRVSVVCPGYVDTPMIAQETGWQPFKMSAEAAAEQTVRGLAANRAVIAFPSVLATMSWIGGQLPDRVRRLTARPFAFKVSSRDGA